MWVTLKCVKESTRDDKTDERCKDEHHVGVLAKGRHRRRVVSRRLT
jgi:hypothetical protein